MTVTIKDSNLTIELNSPGNGTGLALARNGWVQEVPNPDPSGVFQDVEETIRISMLDSSDQDRASDLQDIATLGQRARDLQDASHPDFLNPAAHVMIGAKTPTESATRWALIRDLRVSKLSSAHYGVGSPISELKLLREGLWRGLSPSSPATALSSTSLRSVTGLGNGCHVTIPPSSIEGDAPGLVIATIAKTGTTDGYRVRLVRDARLTNTFAFNPFLWTADPAEIYSQHMVNVSTMPANLEGITPDTIPYTTVQKPGIPGALAGWYIDPLAYAGRHRVLAIYTSYGAEAGGATLRVTHGFTSQNYVYGENVTVDDLDGTAWSLQELGQITIPAGGQSIRGNAPSSSPYEIRIISVAPAGNLYLAGICLVPIDLDGVAGELYPSTYTAHFDGEIERLYITVTSTGDNVRTVPISGRFPTIKPGSYNRFYVLPEMGGYSQSLLINPAQNLTFTLGYIPRYGTIS